MKLVGEILKETRNIKKLSLLSVSKKLNISQGYLKAIEDGDFSKIPGEVYARGFIRAYADFLNFDSNEIVNQYKTQVSFLETDESIELPKPINIFQPSKSYRLVSFLTIAFIFTGFYFMFVHNSNLLPEYAITPAISESSIAEIEEFELETALLEMNKKNEEIKIIQDNREVIASLPSVLDNDDVSKLISIKALKSTWIQLRNQKDEIIYSKLMEPDDEYVYSILDNYTFTTGNAGNLVVSIGDKVLGKLGKSGEVLDSISISLFYFSN